MPILNPPGSGSPYAGGSVATQQNAAQNKSSSVIPPVGAPAPSGQGSTPFGSVGNILVLDNGWYVLIGCVAGIMFSGTRAAPIVTGILGVALIVQLRLLLSGQ